VVIDTLEICANDGEKGTLCYGGYDIHDLAAQSNFEEVVYLLWHGRLPNAAELEEFEGALPANRSVPPEILTC
jgi:citrate synthase